VEPLEWDSIPQEEESCAQPVELSDEERRQRQAAFEDWGYEPPEDDEMSEWSLYEALFAANDRQACRENQQHPSADPRRQGGDGQSAHRHEKGGCPRRVDTGVQAQRDAVQASYSAGPNEDCQQCGAVKYAQSCVFAHRDRYAAAVADHPEYRVHAGQAC
jgi:hypothetical protein